MNDKKISKEHNNFKTYSTLATIFIITVFMVSIINSSKNKYVSFTSIWFIILSVNGLKMWI